MNAKKKLIEYLLLIALYLLICVALYASSASAAVSFPYSDAVATEYDFNQFVANITSNSSYTPLQIQAAIITSGEKSSNIRMTNIIKIPSGYLVYGSLIDYSIPNNKLFNPWFNTSRQKAIFYANDTQTGIAAINISNANGVTNLSWAHFNGSALPDYSDIVCTINNQTTGAWCFYDNTTDPAILYFNKSIPGQPEIYYNGTGVYNNASNFNGSKTFYIFDGYRQWNLSYINPIGTWVKNGAIYQQTSVVGATQKVSYITDNSIPNNSVITAKWRVPTSFGVSGRNGVLIGEDTSSFLYGATDYFANPTTQNDVLQDSNLWGTQANNGFTLSLNTWYITAGRVHYNVSAFMNSMTYNVGIYPDGWQGAATGGFFANSRKVAGLYGGYDNAIDFNYWFVRNETLISFGTPTQLNYTAMAITSYSNNLTNDNSLALATFVPKIIMFNASLTDNCDNCTWSVNNVPITNFTSANQTSTNYSFVAAGVYLVNLVAYNSTFNSTTTLTWTVTMSVLTIVNLDGFVNNTPLGAYVNGVRVDLINTTGTGSNFTTWSQNHLLGNTTNLAPTIEPSEPGTGERVYNVTYWANNSDIEVLVWAHAINVSQTAGVFFYIDGVLVAAQSGRPLGAAEESFREITVTVPRYSNYTVDIRNFHHYFWTESPQVSGYYRFVNVPSGNYSLLFRQVGYDNFTHPILLTSNMRYNATISPTVEDDTDLMSVAVLGFIIGLLALALIVKHRKLLKHDGVH